MTSQAHTAYDQLCDHLRETALLGSVESLLARYRELVPEQVVAAMPAAGG